ncbi:MAG: N-acetylmuramoyl-L-alanine amidase [Fimbriimonadaceae bacterium]|nr:N-acetylmuramoyl-L-alanine amidase [Fimbriimonadaceae bacterium]
MKRALWATLMLSVPLAQGQDYPGAYWKPADPSNYTVAERPTTYPIQYVVIHTVQGSWLGALNWFANPASNVSAHYTMRSADGYVGQSVLEKNVGWHAGNWWYNCRSVGIEHEGYVDDPRWYTDVMYRASADLTRYLVRKYGVSVTRANVLGHVEVPGATHTDPGPNWDWAKYLFLVRTSGRAIAWDFPAKMAPGERREVRLIVHNDGLDAWPSSGTGWVKLGTQDPQDRPSPFFTAGSWADRHRPRAVDRSVAYGQTFDFRFTMTAPHQPGRYVESFQPVAEGVGYFGPIVTFVIDVGTTESVVDNRDVGFTVSGSWSTGTTAPGRYGDDYRYAATGPSAADYAEWNLNAPEDGVYDVYAWWSQGTNRCDRTLYTIYGAEPWQRVRTTVDQQANGGQWNRLGSIRLRAGSGKVRLFATSPTGGKVCIADAVRFVGPGVDRTVRAPSTGRLGFLDKLVDDAEPALRFFYSLTDAQKRRALNRRPLEYGELGDQSRTLFREAAVLGAGLETLRFFDRASFFLETFRRRKAIEPRSGAIVRGPLVDAGKGARPYDGVEVSFSFGLDSGRATTYRFEADLAESPADPYLASFLADRDRIVERGCDVFPQPPSDCLLNAPKG